MIAANVVLFLLSAGSLAFILRYRVHIQVTYQKTGRSARPTTTAVLPPPTEPDPHILADLAETLVSLGASKQRARAAARRAIMHSRGPVTFESLLRSAIAETNVA